MMGMMDNYFIRRPALSGLAWLVLLIAIFLQCSFEKPQVPQWDLPIQLPLFEKKYSLQELSQKTPNLFITDQGLLGLQISGPIDTNRVGNRLAMENFNRSFNLGLGAVEINSTGRVAQSFATDEIWPGLLATEAQQLVLPAMAEIRINGQNTEEQDFLSLSLKSGQASLTIDNQFPIAFKPITIRLLAQVGGAVLMTFELPNGIASGQIVQKSLDLSNLVIPEKIAWEVLTSTPGSNGQAIWLKKSQTIKLSLEFKNLIIEKMVAKFKPVSITQTETITLPADIAIDQGRFGAGYIILTGTNNSELDATLNAEFADIQTPAQQPLRMQLGVRSNSNANRVIDLKGCAVDLNLPMPGLAQSLAIRVQGSTQGTGENYATLESQDLISLDLRVENVYFDQITGRLAERQFQLPPVTRSVQIPTGLEAVAFSQGKLVLELFSTIDMPIRLQGQVTAQNAARQSRSLPYEVNNLSKNVATQVVYTEDNSPILDLLNLLPSSLTTSGVSYVGDGSTIGTITGTDFVCGRYRFESPAILAWNDSEVKIDTTMIYITPEDGTDSNPADTRIDGDLTRRLQKCSLDLTVRHSLPIAMKWQMKFSRHLSHLVDRPDLTIGPLILKAPVMDHSGRSLNPVATKFQIALTDPDLALFKNPSDTVKTLYVLTQAFFAKSNGPVQFYASDSLSAHGQATLSILIDDK